jgi:urease accessory protein
MASWRQGEDPEAFSAVADLDGWLLAQREAAELRAQQRQMGQSLLQLLAELGWPLPRLAGRPVPRLAWPAAWAWAGLCLELDPLEQVEAFLFSWVANQLSAAVRLVPLGSTQAQRLQLALAPLIEQRALALLTAEPRQMASGGVGAGMAQLGHAELYSRLFRS